MAGAPVDLDHLDRFTGGDKTLNAEILRIFDGQIGELSARLLRVLEERDARSWRELIHAIKGAARAVGAFSMGEAAAAAEPLDPAMSRDRALEAFEDLESKSEAVRAFIAAYLAA